MAIYHLEAKVISRSQGRSSVAAAAYRSCDKIIDDRTGLTHNFLKKENDLLRSQILLPENAPSWMKDRALLWNAVEHSEVRKDAQLAREITISLPTELSHDQNWDLACEFVQKEFVNKGMVADINFHKGHGGEQPHVHIMLSTREVTEDGFGKKVRAWNDRALLQNVRESWANTCNHTLAFYGHDVRIDHRTLEAQGIELEPQNKIGPKMASHHEDRQAEHQEIARENGERIIDSPEIVLKAITTQYSTFTHQDIARVVNRYTTEGQFNEAYQKVLASKELVQLGQDQRGRDRYTTIEMLEIETNLVWKAKDMSERGGHRIESSVIESIVEQYKLSGESEITFKGLLGEGDFQNLVGIAGSGKSYLLGAVREVYEASGHRVIGMALAGKAAENLQESSGIESRTIASLIRTWDQGFDRLNKKDVIVIDEAAMVDSKQYARIIEEAANAGAKIIAAFDPEQLQPISAGAPARAVAERIGFVELTEVRRQKEPWQREATQNFARGWTEEGLNAYAQHDCIHFNATPGRAMEAMLDNWYEMRSNHPDKIQLMLASTRAEVKALNEGARAKLIDDGLIGGRDRKEHRIETANGPRSFSEGDRVYFMQNEYQDLHVKNGTLGTIQKIEDREWTVKIDGAGGEAERFVQFNVAEYKHLDHGYATTIHKGQGATVDHTHTLASRYFDRHLTYVAMTRHRETANLYCDRITFPTVQSMADRLNREQYKDCTLDFAKSRGLEVKEEFRLSQQNAQRDIGKGFDREQFQKGRDRGGRDDL